MKTKIEKQRVTLCFKVCGNINPRQLQFNSLYDQLILKEYGSTLSSKLFTLIEELKLGILCVSSKGPTYIFLPQGFIDLYSPTRALEY